MAPRSSFLFLLLVLLVLLPFSADAQSASESEAKHTVLRFLEAQRRGDTHTMRSLMAGGLLEERGTLLSNPSYPVYLVETLAHVEFAVDWAETLGPAAVLVQASITYRPGDTIARHYVLRNKGDNGMESDAFLIHEDYDPDFR